MTAGDFLSGYYRRRLFGNIKLCDLPVAGEGAPRFTFYATNMQTGRSFRFR
ncbi:hypothetical protein [Candidatus Nitrosacidococcus sp. I8]|uniref:hypothetical protein n=1 Tax=Candidatus Nitrosacidococcus sp. I8 TaxID=2942908 RepID=UPI002226B9B4|nr:hypothetical protein [Candidatus Nitrosacidococcus sp. I8]CAH9017526.1 hypothetical protein NURINAE_00425 [Candidatus Nitrosacidococcus sp. I8]